MSNNLIDLPPSTFDFIYSNITLTHIPQEVAIEAYIRDFVRVLKPNGYMLFQLPTSVPLFLRIKLRRHVYHILKLVRVPPAFLHDKLGLNPIKIMQVPKTRVISWMSPGAEIIEVLGEGGTGTRYLAKKL